MREARFMPDTSRLVTAEELERFPRDDYRYELVDGRLIQMSPTGWQHGRIVARILFLLAEHIRRRNLGEVVTEVGFTLRSSPDTVRAPDVAFVRRERLPAQIPRGFWRGSPDLAIEVLSPDDRPGEVRAKLDEYLTHGARSVVVIDPDEQTATIHRPAAPRVTLRLTDEVDLADVVDGFRCRVRDLFD